MKIKEANVRVKHYLVTLDNTKYPFEKLSELEKIVQLLFGSDVRITHFSTDPVTGKTLVHFDDKIAIIEAVHWGMCQQ